MPAIGKNNKVMFSDQEQIFIKNNYQHYTNQQLAERMGCKLTVLRNYLYKNQMKRIEMEYWTPEMVEYLIKNYKSIGDTELAKIFQKKYPKNKPWTKKHIEKKRRYLNLKRSKYIQKKIHQRNVDNGCGKVASKKRWLKTGFNTYGTVVNWNNRLFIKTKKGYMLYARYVFEQNYGLLSSNENVFHIDGNPLNCEPSNLYKVTNQEQGYINRLPPEQRVEKIVQVISTKYNGQKVTIKKNTDYIIIKKVREKYAVSFQNKTHVYNPNEIIYMFNLIKRK